MPSKLELAISSLEVLVPIAKAIPVLGSPVEGSLEAAKEILKYAQGVRNNKDATAELALDAARWVQDIVNTVDGAREELPKLRSLQADVQSLLDVLEKIALFLSQRVGPTSIRRAMKDALNKAEDTDKLKALKEEMRGAYERFSVKSSIRTEVAVHKVASNAETEKNKNLLLSLEPVVKASYNAPNASPPCLEGTREELLFKIYEWFESDDPHQRRVFWLNGLAGTGKTTVARTVARKYESRNQLAGTFFFSRNDIKLLRDPLAVIPTLAYEIGYRFPAFRTVICRGIDSDPLVRRKSMEMQGNVLFGQLSQAAQPHDHLLLVLDAMDECDGSDHGRLVDVIMSLPGVFRILITSRSEDTFKAIFSQPGTQQFALHQDIAEPVVKSDIHFYLRHQLNDVARKCQLPIPFPHPDVLDELVRRADTLFIYAATLVKWISAAGEDPEDRLDELVKQNVDDVPYQYSALDMVYSQILSQAAQTDGNAEKRIRALQIVLSTIVFLQEPLTVSAIAHITDVKQTKLLLSRMSAVMASEKEGGSIRLFHASFSDFVTNKDRCRDMQLLVNPSEGHARLALRCLQIMNESLRKDICRIGDPSLRNNNVPDLAQRLEFYAPSSLRYACKYWLTHVRLAGNLSKELTEHLRAFCTAHLLHWLELLSVMHVLSEIFVDMAPLLTHLLGFEELRGESICGLLADMERLAATYRVPITENALHVYHSAVVTMPDCRLRESLAEDESDQIPVLVSKRLTGWDSERKILYGHQQAVTSVAFSSNGEFIVSGSWDETVRVWDTATGTEQLILTGHTSTVASVAFSSNGKSVVSGSHDHTVRVWDAVTGVQQSSMTGHINTVRSVAFSSDGKSIVSGSADKTVRVWDVTTGEEQHVMTGHTDGVNSATFSSDGKWVVSGSDDHSVRVWEVTMGINQHALTGHRYRVTSTAFSSDSTRIVSGSGDGTYRVWDAMTGAELHVVAVDLNLGPIESVAFSSNDKLIVAGLRDNTLRVWDSMTGTQQHIMNGHVDMVTSVAFSPCNDKLILSGSYDTTVCLWGATTSIERHSMPGHTTYVTSVAFSGDGKTIASASRDDTVHVWDAITGMQQHSLTGHVGGVISVAFSADGKWIVSGSLDCKVRVWDAIAGAEQHVMAGHTDWARSVAFSSDGKSIVSGSADATVRVWDTATGAEKHVMTGHTSWVTSVAFSSDGKSIVSGSWDHTIRVWDAATGAEKHILTGHTDAVLSVAFSSDCKLIASGSEDDTVRLWDAMTGAERSSMIGHAGAVSSVAFSSNGMAVVSRSDEFGENVRVWDATTGTPLECGTSLQEGEAFYMLDSQGWISCWSHRGTWQRLCWVPADRRGQVLAYCGQTLCIGGRAGAITIMNFSAVM